MNKEYRCKSIKILFLVIAIVISSVACNFSSNTFTKKDFGDLVGATVSDVIATGVEKEVNNLLENIKTKKTNDNENKKVLSDDVDLTDYGLEVHFIDVGQGDSTLIICDGEAMLIDAGENDKGTLVQKYLLDKNIKELKYLVGTHPDSDHYGGLDVIITKFDIGKIFLPNFTKDTRTVEDVYNAIEYKNYKISDFAESDRYELGKAYFEFVNIKNDYGENTNNYSLVIKLTHGENTFLFCGDIESEAESDIVSSGTDIDIDVLKIPHHGSNSSSTLDFVKATSPFLGIVSSGQDNEYGHPHEEIVDRYISLGIKLMDTKNNCDIIIYSNGTQMHLIGK